MFVSYFLKYRQGVSGADSVRCLASDCGRVVHVELLYGARTCSIVGIAQGIDRNHGAAGTLHEEEVQVVCVGAVWRICLDINTIYSVVHIEVIDIDRAGEGFERSEDV